MKIILKILSVFDYWYHKILTWIFFALCAVVLVWVISQLTLQDYIMFVMILWTMAEIAVMLVWIGIKWSFGLLLYSVQLPNMPANPLWAILLSIGFCIWVFHVTSDDRPHAIKEEERLKKERIEKELKAKGYL